MRLILKTKEIWMLETAPGEQKFWAGMTLLEEASDFPCFSPSCRTEQVPPSGNRETQQAAFSVTRQDQKGGLTLGGCFDGGWGWETISRQTEEGALVGSLLCNPQALCWLRESPSVICQFLIFQVLGLSYLMPSL